MKKITNTLRENGVFLCLVLAVILAAVILTLQGLIGQDPFCEGLFLDAPVRAVQASDAVYYVTDSGYTILIGDSSGKILSRVDGANESRSFACVKELASCDDGEFYVLDKILASDDVTSVSERLLHFTRYGRRCEVLYEEDTAGEQTVLTALQVADGAVRFCRINDAGIAVCTLVDGVLKEERTVSMPGANADVYDLACSSEGTLAAITLDGRLLIWSAAEEKPQEFSAYEQNDTGYMLLTEAVFDGTELYLNDIGRRCVYRLDAEGLQTILEASVFADAESDAIYDMPLLSGLCVSQGAVTAMISEYTYDAEQDAHDYVYAVGGVDAQGNIILDTDQVEVSLGWRLEVCLVYLSILAAVLLACYAGWNFIRLLRGLSENRSHLQIIILLGITAVSFVVGMYVFNIGTQRLVGTSTDNLANTGRLLRMELSAEDLQSLNSPEAYDSDAYHRIDETVRDVLHYGQAVSSSIYAVIYRQQNNILYEAYRNAGANPVLFPLAGGYAGSVEEEIAATGELYTVNGLATSEGVFSYVDVPVYDEAGEFIALLEIGESYTAIVQENNAMMRKIMIQVFMVLIISMLLFTEIHAVTEAWRERRASVSQKAPLPPAVIRPIAFWTFFTANITTAFLPIYGISLWNESFPLQQELAAALPLSAELICGAVFSLLCGRWLRRTSPKLLCSIGAVLYIGGNLASALAVNLWMLIAANSMCGVGSGLLLVSINTWIAQQQDEHSQNQGFVHYNAAYLSGMNCGSVVGAIVWESYGITAAYITAGVSGFLLLLTVLVFLDRSNRLPAATEKPLPLRRLFSPKVIRYFLFLTVPYLVCASFLSYFFPIIGEQNQLSATEISMAFLISGVISIYVGSEIGDVLVEKLGVRRAMILASFMYVIALAYLVYQPEISSCYVVIVLFALADSFGLAAQAVYYANLEEVKQCGEGRALAVNSTIESITAACGSLIFGAALLMGYRTGIFIIDLVLGILLMCFVLGERLHERNRASQPES